MKSKNNKIFSKVDVDQIQSLAQVSGFFIA
jgi:hypothetical protein